MTKFIYFGVYNMGCWVVMNSPGVLTPRCAPLGVGVSGARAARATPHEE